MCNAECVSGLCVRKFLCASRNVEHIYSWEFTLMYFFSVAL